MSEDEITVSRPPHENEDGKSFPWVMALVFGGIFIILGFFSGSYSGEAKLDWYRALDKPPGTPPDWVFPVAWTILYAMMGLSLALLLAAPPVFKEKFKALLFFGVQLALNLAWTPVFFGAHLMLPALVIILALLAAIFLTIRAAFPLSKPAALLLLPYLAWVAYATYLNAGFVVKNL